MKSRLTSIARGARTRGRGVATWSALRGALRGALAVACIAGPRASAASPDLTLDTNATLGLTACEVLPIDLPAAGDPILTMLMIEGRPAVLFLEPQTVRAPDYQVLVQRADGSLAPARASPARTMRGTVFGVDGATAAGSRLEHGLVAAVRLPGGETMWIEPIAGRVPGSMADDHVFYRGADVMPHDGRCAADDLARVARPVAAPDAPPDAPERAAADPPAARGGSGLWQAEVACDADYEYFQDYGSVPAVEARINSVINAVNLQYESEVGITHLVSSIIVRTAEPDPYTSSDASVLITELRNYWIANHSGVQRDVVHLFTGKSLQSGVIGIAYVGAVCSSFGYGLAESDFNNNFSCATDLSAHEFGHNWDADHCTCGGNTMNPSITCSNNFHDTFTEPEIVAFRDSIGCLDWVPSTGACCFDNGSCQVLSESDCDDGLGTYQGDGVSCVAADCQPSVTGRCCLVGNCFDVTELACDLAGGNYFGDGTDCTGSPCSSTEAPLSCVTFNKGAGSGNVNRLDVSDDSYTRVTSVGGSRQKTRTTICADSPFTSVSLLRLRVETRTNRPNVKTKIYLRNWAAGKWTRIASFNQEDARDKSKGFNLTNPSRFVNASDGRILMRIWTERRNSTRAHKLWTDHVEVTVRP